MKNTKHILIYAKFIEGYGMGHITRSKTLYQYGKTRGIPVHFVTGMETCSIEEFLHTSPRYHAIIHDAAFYDEKELVTLKAHTDRLCLLDYFGSNPAVDCAVNLFERESIDPTSTMKHFTGVRYALIQDNVLKARRNRPYFRKKQPKILVSIGGEDKQRLAARITRSLTGLRKAFNVTVISRHIRPLRRKGLQIIRHTNDIGQYIGQSDVIICNAGTTLLEAFCIGTPAITVAQNSFEAKFKASLSKDVPIYSQGLLKKPSYLIFGLKHTITRRYRRLVDGEGKKRIWQLCCES